jgi:hypothetical protein
VVKQRTDKGEVEETAMRRYFDSCNRNKIAALPIFSKIHDGKCSIIGYYITKAQAIAIGEMLEALANSNKIFFDEINLDYNGLKDEEFYLFLKALQKNTALRKITYVNNEIGRKSIDQINIMLSGENRHQIQELRLASVKANPLDIK